MAEEPTHLDEIKWPKKCATCGDMVTASGWLYEHQLYCEAHKPVARTPATTDVPIDTTSRSNASKEDKAIITKVRCPLTQRFHPESEMVTVYTREHLPLRISQLAVDLITVQYWAKVEGLWTVPRKPKVDEMPVPVEAKA